MIHQDIKDRVQWFKELEDYVNSQIQDPQAAKIVYRRLVFEEK